MVLLLGALCLACDPEHNDDELRAGDLEAEELDEHDAAVDDSPQADVPLKGATRTVNADAAFLTCDWVKSTPATSSAVHTREAACPSSQQVLSGGCYGAELNRQVLQSHPYESSSPDGNVPDSEGWEVTTDTTGWACRFGSGNATDQTLALALCCDD
ncbi:MAG TPA: hypothetical protein VG755_17040 [Nannocystaceae bacterium]|nr:hypothetical protein [Nannocystaceae bacterium]